MARRRGRAASTDATAPRIKKTIVLEVATARRLGAFACHCGLTESKVVADALRVHLEGYRSYRVGDAAGEEGRPTVRIADPAGEGRESA